MVNTSQAAGFRVQLTLRPGDPDSGSKQDQEPQQNLQFLSGSVGSLGFNLD